MLKSYVALLCLGKSDFEAVNGMREDDYFAESLAVPQVPSEGTLRQRMDARRGFCRWSKTPPSNFFTVLMRRSRPWRWGWWRWMRM